MTPTEFIGIIAAIIGIFAVLFGWSYHVWRSSFKILRAIDDVTSLTTRIEKERAETKEHLVELRKEAEKRNTELWIKVNELQNQLIDLYKARS